jgi:hypothetical protein
MIFRAIRGDPDPLPPSKSATATCKMHSKYCKIQCKYCNTLTMWSYNWISRNFQNLDLQCACIHTLCSCYLESHYSQTASGFSVVFPVEFLVIHMLYSHCVVLGDCYQCIVLTRPSQESFTHAGEGLQNHRPMLGAKDRRPAGMSG